MKRNIGVILSLVLVLSSPIAGISHAQGAVALAPIGTAFTYQGQLVYNGAPANGVFEFQFKLWDALSGGAQIGSTWTTIGTASKGNFTTMLDFGASAFQGAIRYLEVNVRFPVGSGSFTTLTPRQDLTPVPYALYAAASPWSGLLGVPAGFADGVDNDTTYTAGVGLALTGNQFVVVYAGTGSAATAARSDHTHPGGAYWSLGGNSGANPATAFLGTTDAVSLTLGVGGVGALRIEPTGGMPNLVADAGQFLVRAQGGTVFDTGSVVFTSTAGALLRITPNALSGAEVSPNVILGYSGNRVSDVSWGSTIGGGGGPFVLCREYLDPPCEVTPSDPFPNQAFGNFSTVAGGLDNTAGVDGPGGMLYPVPAATVGGGVSNTAAGWYATVSGGRANTAAGSMDTVGGGFSNTADSGPGDMVPSEGATVSGGVANAAAGHAATVGGGNYNRADADYSTVSGGGRFSLHEAVIGNWASDRFATVGGGGDNRAGNANADTEDATAATVAGGMDNTASGAYSTVPGGAGNTAQGAYSLAAGRSAQALHDGAFVWADSTDEPFASGQADQFLVRAWGGVLFSTTGDDPYGTGDWVHLNTSSVDLGNRYGGLLTMKINTFSRHPEEYDELSPSIEFGYSGNTIQDGTVGSTISGGGGTYVQYSQSAPPEAVYPAKPNRTFGNFSTVGGGLGNTAGPVDSGLGAVVGSTVAGGGYNTAGDEGATVAGGAYNTAGGGFATIGGGWENSATLEGDTVAGGEGNTANGGDAAVGGGANNQATGAAAVVGGGFANIASADYATVSGGGPSPADNPAKANRATDKYATVGGGGNNQAGNANADPGDASGATVGGGTNNIASGTASTVSGGNANQATGYAASAGGGIGNIVAGQNATVAGGAGNQAAGMRATVAGGAQNSASGSYASIPGGSGNTAQGAYSFAAGYQAAAQANGCYVWADSTGGAVTCSTVNAWMARAAGGYTLYTNAANTSGARLAAGSGSWSSLSDQAMKENYEAISAEEILFRVSQLPITKWNYTSQDESIRHIGPTAQDFYAAFGVGEDDVSISTIDADGVALAAIQALYGRFTALEDENASLKARNQTQQSQIDDLTARLAALEKAVAELANK